VSPTGGVQEGASSSTTGQLVAALRVYAYVGARRLRGWLEPAAVFPPDPTGGPLWLLGERYGDEAEGEGEACCGVREGNLLPHLPGIV
jgi:hypothetical protein